MVSLPVVGAVSTFEIILVGTGLVLLAGLALFMGGVFRRIKKKEKSEPDFDPQDIENMVVPQLYDLVEKWGDSSSVKLRYGWDTKGIVESTLDYTAPVEVDGKDLDGDKIEVNFDKENLDEADIDSRTKELLEEYENEPIYVLLVREEGLINSISYAMASAMGKKEAFSDLVIVPERLMTDNSDYVTISKNTDFSRFAGMDVATETSVHNFIQFVGFKNLYEQALRDQQNYHEQINLFNSGFSQLLQKQKVKAEAEANKYQGKTKGMVEED